MARFRPPPFHNRRIQLTNNFSLLAYTLASTLCLSACGGGDSAVSSDAGSSSNVPTNSPTQSVPGTVATPQYAGASAQLAMFIAINQYRTQCGFPALRENTILDQAAQAHAKYEGLNNVITDTEVQGRPGFTGVTGADTAATLGWPAGVFTGRGDAGFYDGALVTPAQFGRQFVSAWASGVYHVSIMTYPANLVGFGEYETTYNGFPAGAGTVQFGQTATYTLANAPQTFPCQGVMGIAYRGAGETPTPPNTSGAWGTPVAVMGNLSDTVMLTSAIYTAPGEAPISLQILNSTADPNHLLGQYQAVAYPTTPLQPNTQYSVVLNGTINGTAFSRTFTFTTGS
ncbi:hypothetical protein R77564_03953 [Ralstonia sp. LMG 32965]|uniref:SCP domain-containing protein n=1 Tax=Ralstonia flatus TaxID=3058601 RepID=A0ABM9L0W1_9RALS|nr:hypothetical protein R77564_03953 [Ralstonia sp. LMG 32965]